MIDGDITSDGEAQSLAGIKAGAETARKAVDEVLGPDGPGPFPPSSGLTRGGRSPRPDRIIVDDPDDVGPEAQERARRAFEGSMPVEHTEDGGR